MMGDDPVWVVIALVVTGLILWLVWPASDSPPSGGLKGGTQNPGKIDCVACENGWYGEDCSDNPPSVVLRGGAPNPGKLDCVACEKGWYGEDCSGECDCGPDQDCNDGISGDGSCKDRCTGNAEWDADASACVCKEGFGGDPAEGCQQCAVDEPRCGSDCKKCSEVCTDAQDCHGDIHTDCSCTEKCGAHSTWDSAAQACACDEGWQTSDGSVPGVGGCTECVDGYWGEDCAKCDCGLNQICEKTQGYCLCKDHFTPCEDGTPRPGLKGCCNTDRDGKKIDDTCGCEVNDPYTPFKKVDGAKFVDGESVACCKDGPHAPGDPGQRLPTQYQDIQLEREDCGCVPIDGSKDQQYYANFGECEWTNYNDKSKGPTRTAAPKHAAGYEFRSEEEKDLAGCGFDDKCGSGCIGWMIPPKGLDEGEFHRCCPKGFGAESSWPDKTWCINNPNGFTCKHNFTCASDYCDTSTTPGICKAS